MKNASKKAIVLLLAAVLLIGCVAGGTFAYLLINTSEVENTFVAGKIGTLTLTEETGKEYTIIPGVEIEKDPVVTFDGYNVDAYVFLKIKADGWTVTESEGKYIYSIDDTTKIDAKMEWTLEGWSAVPGVTGVYYKEVAEDAGKQEWSVISGDTITVGTGITEDTIKNYTKSLTFTAYAVQKDTFADAAAAWAQVKTENSIA